MNLRLQRHHSYILFIPASDENYVASLRKFLGDFGALVEIAVMDGLHSVTVVELVP